jgi:hypothetical protein
MQEGVLAIYSYEKLAAAILQLGQKDRVILPIAESGMKCFRFGYRRSMNSELSSDLEVKLKRKLKVKQVRA